MKMIHLNTHVQQRVPPLSSVSYVKDALKYVRCEFQFRRAFDETVAQGMRQRLLNYIDFCDRSFPGFISSCWLTKNQPTRL